MTDTNIATIQQKPPIVVMRERLVERKAELKAALGYDIDPDHFIRAIVTSAQINADLLACSFNSLWLACMRACRDGLLPDGVEGAIVPYKTSANWIPMYRGLLKRFRQSGQCKWIAADIVREGEMFEHYVDETGEHFRHVPGDDDSKPIVKVYAAALTKDGAFYVAVMSMAEVGKIQKMSRATREDAPWKMWPEEMQKKTALRRLSKLLPSGRDVMDGDDLSMIDAPSIQPASPAAERLLNEIRRPQGAAESLDTFAGGGPSAAPLASNTPDSQTEQGGDGGHVSHTVAATAEDAQTIDHLAEADGDPIKAAYERGMADKLKGMSRKAMPGEYRESSRSHEGIAWQAGFDDKPLPSWGD